MAEKVAYITIVYNSHQTGHVTKCVSMNFVIFLVIFNSNRIITYAMLRYNEYTIYKPLNDLIKSVCASSLYILT